MGRYLTVRSYITTGSALRNGSSLPESSSNEAAVITKEEDIVNLPQTDFTRRRILGGGGELEDFRLIGPVCPHCLIARTEEGRREESTEEKTLLCMQDFEWFG